MPRSSPLARARKLGQRLGHESPARCSRSARSRRPSCSAPGAARPRAGSARRGLAVDHEPAKGAQRAKRLAEDLAADHLEDHVDRLPPLASTAARPVLPARARHATWAPSSERQAPLSSVEAVAITCAPARARAAPRASRHRPPPRAPPRLARVDSPAGQDEMPRGHALNEQRQREAVVDAVRDRQAQRLLSDRPLRIAADAGERQDPLAGVRAQPTTSPPGTYGGEAAR